MAMFPRIQSPCPYQANLAAILDGDMCRMCKREVVDLTAMDDAGRVAFFSNCETEVCVSYRVPIRSALGIAALAAAAVAALPAAAQEIAAPVTVDAPAVDLSSTALPVSTPAGSDEVLIGQGEEVIVVGGGITDTRNVEFVAVTEDANVPELPVIYETPAPAPTVSK